MGIIVAEGDLAPVRAYNGTAQGESQTETSLTVRHLLAAAVKHSEYIWLFRIRDAGTIVGDSNSDMVVFPLAADPDRGARHY